VNTTGFVATVKAEGFNVAHAPFAPFAMVGGALAAAAA